MQNMITIIDIIQMICSEKNDEVLFPFWFLVAICHRYVSIGVHQIRILLWILLIYITIMVWLDLVIPLYDTILIRRCWGEGAQHSGQRH